MKSINHQRIVLRSLVASFVCLTSCDQAAPVTQAESTIQVPSRGALVARGMSDGALIDGIIAKAPPSQRDKWREALNRGSVVAVVAQDSDVAAFGRELIARRSVALEESPYTDAQRRRAESMAANSKKILVAVNREAPSRAPAVSIVRAPGDSGVPLVLVRSDATPEDLDFAVKVAAAEASRETKPVTQTTTYGVRNSSKTGSRNKESARALLAKLRGPGLKTEKRSFAGRGTIDAVAIRVRGKPDPDHK